MTVTERFLNYIKINTQSDDDCPDTPSSPCQWNLAKLLADELTAMGASDVRLSDKGYVYATIPATEGCENVPALGFIAHMDTAPDFSGKDVNPQIIQNYNGDDVVLGNSGRVLKVSDFPHLTELVGRTLITTDGTTLLGADDKAGVAEIMTLAEILLNEGRPHGKICIGFTPDEEVGHGADHFDVEGFGADYAYTVDGGEAGDIEWENFNAAAAVVEIEGFNVHPGSAKNTMINAALVATEFAAMLPSAETPRHTDGYEGFFHLCAIEGGVEKAKLVYIIRDHSANHFDSRKETMKQATKILTERYGEGTVKLTVTESYRNMKEMILPCKFVIDYAKNAIERVGLTPVEPPIRGGTDGARLSFMGLPCPNLGTGGYAFHGPYEHTTVEGLENATKILLEIVEEFRKHV